MGDCAVVGALKFTGQDPVPRVAGFAISLGSLPPFDLGHYYSVDWP